MMCTGSSLLSGPRLAGLTASNSSEGLFGSIIARDDPYGWAGKIQYMNWKLLGVQEILAPMAPGGMEKPMVAEEPAPKKLPTNPSLITNRGQIPLDKVARITWMPEERMKMGFETPGWQGK